MSIEREPQPADRRNGRAERPHSIEIDFSVEEWNAIELESLSARVDINVVLQRVVRHQVMPRWNEKDAPPNR